MKKVLLLVFFVTSAFMVSASASTPACVNCHAGLPDAALQGGKAHAEQYQGIHEKMTNPMHMSLKDCASCHSPENLKSADSASASLKGGSLEALGTSASCVGCHNKAGTPAAYYTDWNMERVKKHTFSN
ncbi:hypothetical protein [Desulfurispira natronophila]|uniref:Mono/diheme cytochrome c family protein n=1 Tax=Desulfurispira natronophila TaxID=682562 RepID=A0A7W8DH06_9BACT|nr:hypothetical protein [Desulfurispira natronophila]MBB5022005.1 mono/diheme cytochrome c family protein [Desulfurispira natronophila]